MIETNSRRKTTPFAVQEMQQPDRESRKTDKQCNNLELTCQTRIPFLTTTHTSNREGTDVSKIGRINNKQQTIETNSLRKPMSLAVK